MKTTNHTLNNHLLKLRNYGNIFDNELWQALRTIHLHINQMVLKQVNNLSCPLQEALDIQRS